METAIVAVAPVLFMLVLGFFLKNGENVHKFNLTNDFWKGIDKLVDYLFFPAAILGNISAAKVSQSDLFKMLGMVLLGIIAITLVSWILKLIFRISNAQFTSLIQGAVKYNNYMFLSIAGSIFIHHNMMVAATLSAYTIILMNIFSILIFSIWNVDDREKSLILLIKNILKNPTIIFSVIALVMKSLNIEFWSGFSKSLIFLGNSSFCIAYLIIGSELRFNVMENLTMIALTNFLKLIGAPLIMFGIVHLLQISGPERDICLLFSMMPTGNSQGMSKYFGGDYRLMADISNTGIVMSIITIPIMLQLLY